MDETTEQMTEQEVQVTEQVPTPEPQGEILEKEVIPEAETKAEPTPEAEAKTVQEELAEQVKLCVIGSKSCEGLGSKLDDVAKELHIRVDALIDQVFVIATRKD